MDFVQARNIDRSRAHQDSHSGIGQEHSNDSASERNQQVLRNHRTEQVGRTGTQGPPNRCIAPSLVRAHQHQIAQVHANDQENCRHSREHEH